MRQYRRGDRIVLRRGAWSMGRRLPDDEVFPGRIVWVGEVIVTTGIQTRHMDTGVEAELDIGLRVGMLARIMAELDQQTVEPPGG